MFEILKINGLTTIFSPLKNFSTAALGIFIKVGARHEKNCLKGIAHFTEHMLFKGTKSNSYRGIKREIEGRGGMLNGYTSQEVTAYYAQFLKKNLRITLDILIDMVMNPLFEPKEIKKERGVILEEIKMYNDLPHFRALSLLDKILWENHPLGEDVIGRFNTVKIIKRNDFKKFKQDYYLPSRMVVCCVGDFSCNRVVDLIKGVIKDSSSRSAPLPSVVPAPFKKIKVIVENKHLDQTHLCIGFRAISYKSKHRFVAELIHIIMGANMSSRLFEEIREKRGLCYDISTELKKYKDSGAFVIHVGLDKKNIKTTFRCIIRELAKIKNNLVVAKELERAKDYLIGQTAMNLERPQGRLFYLADSYIALGKIFTLAELKREVDKIDREVILHLAEKIFYFKGICATCVGDIDESLGERLQRIIEEEVGN